MSQDIFSRLLGTLKNTFRINRVTIDASGLTAARTVTLPDASMTVAGVNRAQTFSATQTYNDGMLKLKDDSGDFGVTLKVLPREPYDPDTEATLTIMTTDTARLLVLNDNVQLPQIFPDAGMTLGQVVALARQIVRY
jgi:hypothetical protein